jgi:hypothetical protein
LADAVAAQGAVAEAAAREPLAHARVVEVALLLQPSAAVSVNPSRMSPRRTSAEDISRRARRLRAFV